MSYTESLKQIILAPNRICKELFTWLWNDCTVTQLILILIGIACIGIILAELKKILEDIREKFTYTIEEYRQDYKLLKTIASNRKIKFIVKDEEEMDEEKMNEEWFKPDHEVSEKERNFRKLLRDAVDEHQVSDEKMKSEFERLMKRMNEGKEQTI